MNESVVIAYLKSCPGHELISILQQVFPHRPEAEPEGNAFEYRMVLSIVNRENVAEQIGETEWGPWNMSVVGYANSERYPPDFGGEPFYQGGKCARCAIEVRSHVKQALCPICGQEVSLS